ncbi:hemoglobin [Brevundimonas alba]|uniref:Hemoglobin n=1 Tax=Brevundimonas alba TaxID=74314 RepID=A0A7X6BNQ7_9CAUL|nr:group 1 truncated hemoglobin [Brevundimonas alba]NJC41194.1 hemoglobin [Brevundimonas alba]
MIRMLSLTAMLAVATPVVAQDPAHMPGEEAVDPYSVADANAGAQPFAGTEMFDAFHGQAGIDRIVDRMLDRSAADPRTAGIFVATDMIRLRRTLKEQFCYVLGGPCAYTGRSMKDAHDDIGLQPADMGALVEHLQTAMEEEGVPFHTQNRFLAKLAPMRRDIVTR